MDGLGNLPLKALPKSLAKSLKLLFNTISNKSTFPDHWKRGEVIPIFKDGDKQNVKNYRGVVLLDCVSKVLERLIFEKLYPRVESLLSDDQHGFRKGRSTTTQMICYLNEVFENINQPTLLSLYLDFEKAFDKVCHEKLLEKLLILGFGGPLLALLESYLSNRS